MLRHRVKMRERNDGEQRSARQRDERPRQRQPAPCADAKSGEIRCREQHNRHVAPAIERVQQAHGLGLFIAGKRIHNRAVEHFDEPAADCGDRHGERQPEERLYNIRKKRQQRQPGRAAQMGENHRSARAEPVGDQRTERIDDHLYDKVDRNQQADLFQRNAELVVKRQKQQRGQIVRDSLRAKPEIARTRGVLRSQFHKNFFSVKQIFERKDYIMPRPARQSEKRGAMKHPGACSFCGAVERKFRALDAQENISSVKSSKK